MREFFFRSFLRTIVQLILLVLLACGSPESRRISADTFFQNELWKSANRLQLVFSEPNQADMPIALAREQSCRRLQKKREQNIAAYLKTRYPSYKDGYKIIENILAVDREGNCTDTVLLRLRNSAQLLHK